MTICYVKPVTPSIFLVPLGECVSGALHWKELVELSKDVGFSGPHLVTARPFVVEEHLRKPLGECFFSKLISLLILSHQRAGFLCLSKQFITVV